MNANEPKSNIIQHDPNKSLHTINNYVQKSGESN